MSVGEACDELDAKLSRLVASHWGGASSPDDVLPLRCRSTAEALLVLRSTPSTLFHGTLLLSLLGELLLCAEDGDILRKEVVQRFAAGESERAIVGEAVRRLRNAVCHPASTEEHEEETGVASFADFVIVNFKEETWAQKVKQRPGELRAREVTLFALRLIDQLGMAQAERWHLKKVRRVRRHHAR